MGRRVTSGIKNRKRTTVYLLNDLADAVDSAHINAQQEVSHRVDRAIFIDALLKAGLNHPTEIHEYIESFNIAEIINNNDGEKSDGDNDKH